MVIISYGQTPLKEKYGDGQLLLYIKTNIFDFPLEVYGAYISIENNKVTIDSVVYQEFKSGTRHPIKRQIIPFSKFKTKHPQISPKIKLQLPSKLISLFKKYGVYYIERLGPTFAPQDTLPHKVLTRYGWKKMKSRNYNKKLFIKFNKKSSVIEFCNELKKLKFIDNATPNYKLTPFANPSDSL